MKTQKQRILEALRSHPDGLSTRYMKRDMGITECHARLSELRADGYDINPIKEDEYGFTIQKLSGEPKRKSYTFEPILDSAGRQIAVRQVIRLV